MNISRPATLKIWVGLLFPFLMSVIFFLYPFVAWRFSPKEPQWEISAADRGMQNCNSNAVMLSEFDGEALSEQEIENLSPRISSEEAMKIATQTIGQRHSNLGVSIYMYGSKPDMARVTLPDNREYLIWWYIIVLDTGSASLLGKAEAVYVDAETGEPLVLITDITVGDPSMTCTMQIETSTYAVMSVGFPLVVSCFFGVITFGVGAYIVFNRKRLFADSDSALDKDEMEDL